MKLTHVLGHNPNWNVDIYHQQKLGEYFLYTAFSLGRSFENKTRYKSLMDIAMLDLQFYGKKNSIRTKGKLEEFSFHPIHNEGEQTNVYFTNCIKQAIEYQEIQGFKNIIIPHFYENNDVSELIATIQEINRYVKNNRKNGHNYFMTLAFSNELILNDAKVEELLFACTDMEINFDGFFIVCDNNPKYKQKLTIDYDLMSNLSSVFKTLKTQNFKTVYAYANFDALIYLSMTDIDFITIGTYENLRNFNIKRFTEDRSGGPSDGYYFSEKLLNSIRAAYIAPIRKKNLLDLIRNEDNIFSDFILEKGYEWNIHKPDVNKNYLLSIGKLLKTISNIENLQERKEFVLKIIENAILNYDLLAENNIILDDESSNYHLSLWKTFLLNN